MDHLQGRRALPNVTKASIMSIYISTTRKWYHVFGEKIIFSFAVIELGNDYCSQSHNGGHFTSESWLCWDHYQQQDISIMQDATAVTFIRDWVFSLSEHLENSTYIFGLSYERPLWCLRWNPVLTESLKFGWWTSAKNDGPPK